MQAPNWIKPSITGAIVGSIATIIVGFSWGGWMLGGSAERMAKQRSAEAATQALVPVCVSQSKGDQQKLEEFAGIRYAYERREFIVKAGWATMPGAESPNRDVAAACAEALAKAAQT